MVVGDARWEYRISTIQTSASSLQSFNTVPYKDDLYESLWGHDTPAASDFWKTCDTVDGQNPAELQTVAILQLAEYLPYHAISTR